MPVVRRRDREPVGADLVRGVAVGRDPVGAGDDAVDLAAAHQMRGRRVRDHRVRDAERLELPGGQPRALEQRPRLVDPDVREQAVLPRGAQRADRGAVAAGREPARVAVRQRARPRAEERSRVRRHPAAALDLFLVQRARPLGARVAAHLLERPDEVHGRRPRLRQHAVGRDRDPPRAPRPARSRTPRRRRSPARRAPRASGSPRRPRPPTRTGARRPRPEAGADRAERPRRLPDERCCRG